LSAEAPTTVARPASRGGGARPRLGEGVELLGEFEDSGLKEAPHLARRADGQVIQLSELLHLVAEHCDGERDHAAIGAAVSERFGKTVSADNVDFLVDKKLRPLGVLAAEDGSTPKLRKRDPLLALRHRTALVPAERVQRIAGVFSHLFHWPVVLAALAGLAAVDAYVFFDHGVGGGLRTAMYEPLLLIGLFATIVLATAFHEVGHASACRFGGGKPGVMGAGVYLVWPAFYCDVTDAYRLSRAGRLRTDLGGVYFNGLVAIAAGAALFVTGYDPLALVVLAMHFIVLQQLVPVLRFDGYYVLSDITGVPDILGRVGSILKSLLPWRRSDDRVRELKPWVRIVVTLYVIVLVPLLAFMLFTTVSNAPRMFATAYDSLGLQLDRIGAKGDVATIALGAVQSLALVLPCAAVVVSLGRFGGRTVRGLGRFASQGPGRAFVTAGAAAAVVAFVGYTWWPNGDYAPLRAGERLTVGDAAAQVSSAGTGRPSFTEEHARRYAPVPTVRQRKAPDAAAPAPASPEAPAPASTTTTEEPVVTTPEPEPAPGAPATTETLPPETTETAPPAETVPADTTTVPAP
jgi:putative peptide zinc metalloprotease protein